MEHPLDDRAVPAGGLPPYPAAGHAIARLHEGDDLLAQVVVVASRRGRINVLIASDLREAIDEGHDHRTHLSGADQAVQPRLQILAQRIDPEEGPAGPRVADDAIR